MLKIILIVMLSSCGNIPVMERKVKVWNGSHENSGICRITKKGDIKNVSPMVEYVLLEHVIDKKKDEVMCIDSSSPEFDKYGAMTWEDIAVVQKYTETLINSCLKWKPQ